MIILQYKLVETCMNAKKKKVPLMIYLEIVCVCLLALLGNEHISCLQLQIGDFFLKSSSSSLNSKSHSKFIWVKTNLQSQKFSDVQKNPLLKTKDTIFFCCNLFFSSANELLLPLSSKKIQNLLYVSTHATTLVFV